MRHQRVPVTLMVVAASLFGVLRFSDQAEAQRGPRQVRPMPGARMGGAKGGPHGARGDADHNTEMRKNHAVPKRSPFASAWAFVEDVGHLCRLK